MKVFFFSSSGKLHEHLSWKELSKKAVGYNGSLLSSFSGGQSLHSLLRAAPKVWHCSQFASFVCSGKIIRWATFVKHVFESLEDAVANPEF